MKGEVKQINGKRVAMTEYRSCNQEGIMSGKRGSTVERFERQYIPEPNSGCWLWTGSLSATGYGWLYAPPKNMVHAHTIAWEVYRGSRQGLHVLHTCDMPSCVNPEHLYLGTHQDNMRDRDTRQRRKPPKGVLNGRATFTEDDIKAIRADSRWPRFIAAAYDVPVSTIKKIIYRQSWRHVL